MSRYRVGINAGPVHVCRRVGGKGVLTRVLVWWIVKPLELLIRGLARPHNVQRSITPEHRTPVATHGWFSPPATRPGWYDSAWGPLYFSGSNWYDLDGRPMF